MEEDPRSLVMALMGSTYGELKKLDDQITSASSTLGRRSDLVKQEMQKVVAASVPQPPPPPMVAPPPPSFTPPPPSFTPSFTTPPPSPPIFQPQVEQAPAEKSQLEFDFDRKARYIEVVDALQAVNERIDDLHQKMDKILELLQTRKLRVPTEAKKKVTGILSS